MFVRNGGAWSTATPFVRVSGSWRPVQRGFVRVSGTWREFFTSLSVSASPSVLAGVGTAGRVIGTGQTSVIVEGGGSFSFLWERVSGDSSIRITAPTAQSTSFTSSFAAAGTRRANFRCRVTNTATGSVLFTNTVAVTLTASSVGGGR